MGATARMHSSWLFTLGSQRFRNENFNSSSDQTVTHQCGRKGWVGTERGIVSNTCFFFLMFYLWCTKDPYACEHPPSAFLTAKCTAHKCSSLSCMCIWYYDSDYLMKILTAIGKGELMMMMMQCDKLNRDEFICVCVVFLKISLKPSVRVQDGTFVNRTMFGGSTLNSICDVFTSFFILVFSFCKYTEKYFMVLNMLS